MERSTIHSVGPASGRSNGLVVLDPVGDIFDLLSRMVLPLRIQRLVGTRDLDPAGRSAAAVYAAYGRMDWRAASVLHSHAPTLVMTFRPEREDAEMALREGLIGYLDAGADPASLERAVRATLLDGEAGFTREVLGRFLQQLRTLSGSAGRLTARQHEIVALIAQGATDKQIAHELGIKPTTAQKHVGRLLRRLDVSSRAAAIAAVQYRPRHT